MEEDNYKEIEFEGKITEDFIAIFHIFQLNEQSDGSDHPDDLVRTDVSFSGLFKCFADVYSFLDEQKLNEIGKKQLEKFKLSHPNEGNIEISSTWAYEEFFKISSIS